MWDEIKEKNQKILQGIFEHNQKIKDGDYIAFSKELNIRTYHNFLSAHLINLLFLDESLYIPNEIVEMLELYNSDCMELIEWEIYENAHHIKNPQSVDSKKTIEFLKKICFDDEGKSFIEEICSQDLLNSKTIAKDINHFLSSISTSIELEIKGEEELIRQICEMRSSGNYIRKSTKIQDVFEKEYRNRGALIRNRLFQHNQKKNNIPEKICFSTDNIGSLNYLHDKNFCQAAVLHISTKDTNSSGTGFIISDDGYALTCAHVVEGANEIYANVIVNDGYPNDVFDGMEVYDVGFCETVYINKELDIALLKTEYCGSSFLQIEKKTMLPELGEEVVVFGYPLGYEMPQSNSFGPNISFYKGYISSNQVSNGNSVTFLDIDVKSGSSGSPVISTKTGKVIGIVSGIKVGGKLALNEKMPYMIPIQHFNALNK